ncbi:DUF1499 domain-containing protein [Halobacillus litoralis]|uniref:DUF1499 domain-containing protein n=1 Tax=Halobacillus litoralis TaxID=45668 RepID=A0A410MAM4_9BACI|nr:DUF1499 domain-containing protein [Halobacillus litoralis]QAS51769.1 DUF1499 domain-containing protein [Halobacillus litoralis]
MTKIYLGVKEGKLAACPSSPNCVSTQTKNHDKQMAPLPFTQDLATSKDMIKQLLSRMERTTIESESDDYIHSIIQTKWLRFKDDVEFYFDSEEKVIHFRSASRVGYSDLGVNNKRMKAFSKQYEEMRRGQT